MVYAAGKNKSGKFRARQPPMKRAKPTMKPRKGWGRPGVPSYPADQVFVMTIKELLVEMQMKYTGLYNLSKKTGHKLLDDIALKIAERMKQVAEQSPESLETGFKLSGAYRRLHPHFGDFQLILDSLHRLQDEAGAPRTNLQESDLISLPTQPHVIDDVPFNKVQAACAKYSDRIAKKISDHIKSLKTDVGTEDSNEEIARKKVREELKKLSPYLPSIIKEVISNHFVPRKAPYHKLRIYGEPFMPNKEIMAPVIKGHRAVSIMRSDRIFNLLRLAVPLQQYTELMALDGSVIGGAKVVIRSSDMPTHVLSKPLVREMRVIFGVTDPGADVDLADEEVPDETIDE